MPRANAVSRMLSDAGHTKASSSSTRIRGFKIYRSGFVCRNRIDGSVRVEYDHGSTLRNVSESRRDEVQENHLNKYRKTLQSKYEVVGDGSVILGSFLIIRDRIERTED